MAATLTQYGEVAVLTLKDDLIGQEVDSMNHRADQALANLQYRIVVDCTHCRGFDSAALEALVNLQEKCETEFGAVKVCGLDETCAKILEMTRLSRRFESFDSLEAAVKSFG